MSRLRPGLVHEPVEAAGVEDEVRHVLHPARGQDGPLAQLEGEGEAPVPRGHQNRALINSSKADNLRLVPQWSLDPHLKVLGAADQYLLPPRLEKLSLGVSSGQYRAL